MRAARNWQRADFFRHIPRDLTEPTTAGSIISVACVVVMVLLFAGEVISYVFPRIQSDMIIMPDLDDRNTIKVSMDMTFPKMPCAVLTLDILDVLHNHMFNSMEHIARTRLDAAGQPISDGRSSDDFVSVAEGCRLEGYIKVAKVPGNFHISSHGRQHLLAQHFPNGINVEHSIHHLSFGTIDVKKLAKKAALHPLDGKEHRSEVPMVYQYFLDIVPTIYESSFSTVHTYQFTGTSSSTPVPARQMAAVVFQYQLSPITVRYSLARVSLTHFLTYVCAIIGGVYTVAGLLSRFVHSSAAQFQRGVLGKGD
ncbi:Endoplasmic Reticulum-Golgi Intermediate Compartment (ERGIC)/Endoplasmic reticulum vesicle transporter, putative [Leishmania donovani]|uniref:Endoplasmic Reticulum-Golgi Intermediate Compartment (ERGIC)/Endoplasmic reticulum vesicle transporter, putative n=1 Tax=Leishmania donovani TaxID=5661 RepID=A0A3Q8IGC2_LEIDO|nr:Endoplasmic Reticulum-Golgi Intermediate Compartment (ERGIC)/Endoplasmic reticulum vesicle transporter, putative [Leishmania donovani]